MIYYKYHIGGIPVYVDTSMKENEILRGRKENKKQFYVMSDKTADAFQQKQRRKKLERICQKDQF